MLEGNLSSVAASCTSYSPDTGNPGLVCKRQTIRSKTGIRTTLQTAYYGGYVSEDLRRCQVSLRPQCRHAIDRRRRDLELPKRLVPRRIKVTKGGSGCETVSQNLYAFHRIFLTVRIGSRFPMYSHKHNHPEPAVSRLGREGPRNKIRFFQPANHPISRPYPR